MNPKIDVKKKAGIEIIYEFKDAINHLLHYYALYINVLAELNTANYSTDADMREALMKLPEEKKDTIIKYCQELRYHATVSHVKYLSIYPQLKLQPNKKVTEAYTRIKDKFVINDEDVLEMIQLLNAVMMSDIIKELLKSNEDLIKNIYMENEQQS